jgi:hypothetical protein
VSAREPQSRADGSSPLLAYLQHQQPRWTAAVDALAAQYAERREQVERQVDQYANVYAGQRAAMVYDVVASRQRRYLERVQPLVKVFAARPAAESLAALAEHGPGPGLSLMAAETRTVQAVADGLRRYCAEHQLDDDAGVAAWAAETEAVRFAPRLDPYVGAVSGVGPALFAYLRMRSGADGLKPDGRVRLQLRQAGFVVPVDPVSMLVLAEAVAEQLDLTRLALDQLLW